MPGLLADSCLQKSAAVHMKSDEKGCLCLPDAIVIGDHGERFLRQHS